MSTTLLILISFTIIGIAYIFKKYAKTDVIETFQPKEISDNLSEPIISYILCMLDTRLNRRLEINAPKEFPNQFGILNGQTIELHWNILNADWISIEGVGFVQAIGKKELYPTQNTQYKITAKNRNHIEEVSFFVRVFPVPIMENLFVKIPDITTNNIELFQTQIPTIQRMDSIQFPTLQLPSVIQIQKDHTAVKPTFPKSTLEKSNKLSFKSKLFDKMEIVFNNNYKIKDIIQTIRKHYE